MMYLLSNYHSNASTNSADPDQTAPWEQSDQDLLCWSFSLIWPFFDFSKFNAGTSNCRNKKGKGF